MISFIPNTIQAEWIFPVTNPGVKVDSINRFLFVRDTTKQKVFGAQILSLGDITGDGCTDVLICRNEGNNLIPNNAYLFYGGLSPDSVFDSEFINFKPNVGKIGDVTGDGFTDFGMYLSGPSYNFFWGGPDFDDDIDFRVPTVLSFTALAGDFDADGHPDMALSTDPNGGFVNIYRIDSARDTIPEYVIPDTSTSFGNNLVVGDFNGDMYPDLAVSANLNVHLDTSRIKFYWGGPDFDTTPDFVISRAIWGFGKILLPIDDFNGDGYGDLFIGGATNDPFGVYYGGPDFDGKMDIILNAARVGGGFYGINSIDLAGDINNDGHTDIIIGHAVSIAALYEAHIYLGGPTTDTLRYSDIYIENAMIPGSQAYFGDEVAGIGDFNGDGIDDFAVRSQTASGGSGWWGEVNFFAGWDATPTDVPYEYDRTLPKAYTLNQNYPNPFNAVTTISFDLPRREQISLSIYDIAGRIIRTLIENNLNAGSYSVRWDGRNDKGEAMSTGVYLCRLEGDRCNETIKVVLLK